MAHIVTIPHEEFVWSSLTTAQQDNICIKYHISKNKNKTLKELQNIVEQLHLNCNDPNNEQTSKPFISLESIRKIKKYKIPIILDKIDSVEWGVNQT